MQAIATLHSLKGRNRRAAPRRTLHLDISLAATGEKVTIHDLSPTGILLETEAALAAFDQIAVELPEAGTMMATVIWSSGHYFGCQFHDVLPRSAVSAALLRSPFEPPVPVPPVAELPVPELPVPAPPVAEPAARKPALPPPALDKDGEDEETGEAGDDRLPFGVRLRFILGSSIALWALILWALGIL